MTEATTKVNSKTATMTSITMTNTTIKAPLPPASRANTGKVLMGEYTFKLTENYRLMIVDPSQNVEVEIPKKSQRHSVTSP